MRVSSLLAVAIAATVLWLLLDARKATPEAQALYRSESASEGYYRGHSAAFWAWQFRTRTRQLQIVRAHLRRRWAPTISYALRLASAVSGVSYWQLRSVSWCESTHDPFARNGHYLGLFQLGWSPFGMSPFDPIANALSAALTVREDGGWRQWECKP
jgi:hypothetical protein